MCRADYRWTTICGRAATPVVQCGGAARAAALTHPYLARCRARRGSDLRIEAPGQARQRAMLGAFDPVPRHLLMHTSATKRSTDFLALLDQLGAAYGTAERTRPLWRFSTTDRSTAAS
jgi:hypothetical protein